MNRKWLFAIALSAIVSGSLARSLGAQSLPNAQQVVTGGKTVSCTYTISPTTSTFNTLLPSPSSTSVCFDQLSTATVTTTAGCGWTAVVNVGTGPVGWLTVTNNAGPSAGSQSIAYKTSGNAHGAVARSGTITIFDGSSKATSAILTVNQASDATHRCGS